MKIHLLFPCVLALALLSPSLSARETKPKTTIIKGKRGTHQFQLRFVTGPFRRSSHKIQTLKGLTWIDGKPEWNKGEKATKNWYGTDGGLPVQEFYSFQVTVDGQKWSVPQRLWSDCYEPNLGTELQSQLSPDGKLLTLKMYGSDAAGAYYVTWLLRANGRHTRTFSPTSNSM